MRGLRNIAAGFFLAVCATIVFLFLYALPRPREAEFIQPARQKRQTAPVTHSKSAVADIRLPMFYSVVHVIDGDTIDIATGGVVERIRLIGINVPETVDPRKPVECFGKEASDAAKKLLAGKRVRTEEDSSQGKYDKHGRVLGYIFTEDGMFLNEYMIAEGYAYEYTYHAPYKYQAEFRNAQKIVRAEQKGLWAPGVCRR